MKYIATLVVTIVALSMHSQASAQQSVVADKKLTVQGRVLPMHTVIINEDGDILQILSNTNQDVTPRIFVNTVSPASEVPLTDDVYAFYRYYVPAGSSKIGTLYQKTVTFSKPIKNTQPSLLKTLL